MKDYEPVLVEHSSAGVFCVPLQTYKEQTGLSDEEFDSHLTEILLRLL